MFPSMESNMIISDGGDGGGVQPAIIKVIGVGGGGSNAVNRMILAGIRGVDFIAVNTDLQVLKESPAQTRIQIGEKISKGLGVGGKPDIGRKAAEENIEGLKDVIKGSDLVFVTAGMGGGTGTGAAPIIAQIAREMDILTVGVVTKPFRFEGQIRMQQAEEGISNIEKYTDTLIVIPNEKVFNVIDDRMPSKALYQIVDDVLRQSIQAITDTITVKGEINRDFADVKNILKEAGSALIGIGESAGFQNVKEAVDKALTSPLLDNFNISKANKMLINLTMNQNAPASVLKEMGDIITGFKMKKEHIFFGHVTDNRIDEKIKVTIIATGFNARSNNNPISVAIRKEAIPALSADRKTFHPSALPPIQKDLFDRKDSKEGANSDNSNPNTSAEYFVKPAYTHWAPRKLNK
jgi:cell division protein FtsZ